MRQRIFTLSTKTQIEFRQIMLAEENLIATTRQSRKGNMEDALDEVMTRCAIRIVDPGPYTFLEVGDKPDWKRMAKGDRFGSMIDLRCLSYKDGHLYEAELRCPSSTCGKKFGWEVNLETELIRQDMPDESLEKIKNGQPFVVEIAGKKISYTIAYGKTEETFDALSAQYPDRDMSSAFRSRIVDIEGVAPRDYMDWLDGNNGDEKCKYPGLSSEEAEDLRDAFDVIDGGIDTSMEAECPHCRGWFDFSLPFSGIFLPGRGIIQRRRIAREQKNASKKMKNLQQENDSEK